ncbi:MAG: ATP synthase F1 subunit epsilon [Bacteroidales bacterium]|nr:ATP synthase F1 subunit epsilon [Bacteroidales bacterium]
MTVEIISPEKITYQGKASLVQVPGSKGCFAILKNHAPIVSTLEAGNIRLVDERNIESTFAISGGIVEVKKNKVTILSN